MQETPQITAEINDYAIRCFRDVADLDYIAARLAYRAALGAQFLWSAQQAIEKYLKCILILNRVPTGDLGHNLQNALDRIHTKTGIIITFKNPEKQIFEQLNNFGPNRYLEFSWDIFDHEIVKLDMLVWHLRQYCQTIAGVACHAVTPHIRATVLKSIESSWDRAPRYGYISTGKLEYILKKKAHPARPALIWQNGWYCGKNRKTVSLQRQMQTENAPLWLRPQILTYIEPLVRLSKGAKTGYQKLAAERQKNKR